MGVRDWSAIVRGALLAAALAIGASGCASVDGGDWRDSEAVAAENDPLEGLNRQIFAANLAVDTFLLRPAAVAYREIVPDFGKDVIRNLLNHLRTPLILINDLAQGEMARAETRSEEHTSELQSLMRISYAVFCLKKKTEQRYNKI